ncbi:hypothetical protein ScPMuIL_002919 [Solemya velum]
MKILILLAFLVLAESVTHTHVPNIEGTPSFLYDLHQHAMFVDAGTACYLTHLSHDQRDMVHSSSMLAYLEDHVVQQITSDKAYKHITKLGHYSADVKRMCADKDVYEFHMTHIGNAARIDHTPNFDNTTSTQFLFDRHEHVAAVVTSSACYVANLGNHEQNLLDTSTGINSLEAILKRELIPGNHYVAVDIIDLHRYGHTINTACSGLSTYAFHRKLLKFEANYFRKRRYPYT